jgi:hypothetical protein
MGPQPLLEDLSLTEYQPDPVSGARLVGGEMLQWSDLDSGVSPGVSRELLRRLFPSVPSRGRVLTVGPRASRCFEDAPAGTEFDVLVRALPDARHMSTVAQLRGGITVYCGSLDRFDPPVTYDLVVALDSPAALCSPDSEGLGHRDIMQRFAKWLTPNGQLVLILENDLGFENLFRLRARDDNTDAAWYRGARGFDHRPLYYREVDDVLASAGLSRTAMYAAFPAIDEVGLLVSRECVEEQPLAETAAALAARIEATHFSDRPALVDPSDLASRLFESHQVLPLASAWVLLGRLTSAEPAPDPTELPALLAAEDVGRPQWQALRSVERVDGRWQQRLAPVVPAMESREGRLVRDFRLLSAVLIPGMTLEAALRKAATAHDVSQIRELVVRYASWLRGEPAGAGPADDGDGDPRFFAVPSNLVLAEGTIAVLDPTWRLSQRLPDDIVLIRGLRDFARRLLRSGSEHPWAPDINPDRLTQTLAAMAAVDVTTRAIDTVARTEAEVDLALEGGDAVSESVAYARNLDVGRSQFVSQSGPARAYREALTLSGRLAQALDDRESQVEWLQLTVRARDRQVGDLERQQSSLRGSASFKIGRFFTWPARGLVSLVRRMMLSAIPPGYIRRAMNLARRLAERA